MPRPRTAWSDAPTPVRTNEEVFITPITRQLLVGTVGLTAAIGVGMAARRTQTSLRLAVRTTIARAANVSLDAVSLGDARIGPTGLVITDLAAGQFAARRVRVVPSLLSIISDRHDATLYIDSLVVEDPPDTPFGRVLIERVEAHVAAHIRAHAHGVVAEPVMPLAPPLVVGDIGIELDRKRHDFTRAAFTGLSIGPLHALAGNLHQRQDSIEIAAAASGVELTGTFTDELAIEVTLTRFPLQFDAESAPWLAHLGIPRGALPLDGHVSARLSRHRESTLDLALTGDGQLDIPRLASTTMTLPRTTFDLRGTLVDEAILASMAIGMSGARFEADVRYGEPDPANEGEDARTVVVTARLPKVECATLMAALPMAMRPALDGIALEGEIAGAFSTHLPIDDPDSLTLDGDLDNHCTVPTEPPLADAGLLLAEAPLLRGALDARGQPRRFLVGPANPSYRALGTLPQHVLSTFVESEDARFFRHKGVDLVQVRRALGHDLEAGTPGHGGSTITQQVAKNLFLSGERTVGRKLEEAVLAWRLEARLGKKRILELYLNLAELGPGIYGIEEGAQAYFHVHASALTGEQGAQLAALLPAPRRGMDELWKRRYAQLRKRLPNALLKTK